MTSENNSVDPRTPTHTTSDPCRPLIVFAEAFGGGLEMRCGNCGTYQPVGSGGEIDLAEIDAAVAAHCDDDDDVAASND